MAPALGGWLTENYNGAGCSTFNVPFGILDSSHFHFLPNGTSAAFRLLGFTALSVGGSPPFRSCLIAAN